MPGYWLSAAGRQSTFFSCPSLAFVQDTRMRAILVIGQWIGHTQSWQSRVAVATLNTTLENEMKKLSVKKATYSHRLQTIRDCIETKKDRVPIMASPPYCLPSEVVLTFVLDRCRCPHGSKNHACFATHFLLIIHIPRIAVTLPPDTTLPPDNDEVRSLVNNKNKIGPKIDPCITP